MKLLKYLLISLILFGQRIDGSQPALKAKQAGEGFNQEQTALLVDAFRFYEAAKVKNDAKRIGSYYQKMNLALDNGADPNVTIQYEKPSFHTISFTKINEPLLDYALRYSDEALVHLLLENGVRTNYQSEDGLSPFRRSLSLLGQARRAIDPQVAIAKLLMRFLIKKKENLNVQDKSGVTPLMLAINQINPSNRANPENVDEALIVERQKIVKSLITYLVEQHQDLDLLSNSGFSALLLAAANNQPIIVQFLIDHGANPSINPKVAAYFRTYPLDPNMKDLLVSAEGGGPKKRAKALEQERKIAAEPAYEHKLPAHERAEGEASEQDDQPGAHAEEAPEEYGIEPGAQIEGA